MPTRPLAPGEVEVCGVGIVKAEDAAQAIERHPHFYDPRALLQAHLLRMKVHADARTRAAGLMALGDLAPLVAMAMGTSNPTVFAFAQQACLRRDPKDASSPCALVSDEQGARLDPDNGAAWLKVADGARLRGEADNMVAALQRVAGSAVHEAREFAFLALALDALPPATNEADRLRLSVALVGIQAALALPSHLAITTHCTQAAAREANRRPLCEALARHLVERGTLLIHTGIGRRMGERVGWSAERVERLAARNHALGRATVDELMATPGGMNSCAALQSSVQSQVDSARLGERIVAEQALARRRLSDDELLTGYREFLRQRAAAASAPK